MIGSWLTKFLNQIKDPSCQWNIKSDPVHGIVMWKVSLRREFTVTPQPFNCEHMTVTAWDEINVNDYFEVFSWVTDWPHSYTVETPYNTNVGVQKIPDRVIWKPVVAKRNNTNPWSCSEPQILVTRAVGSTWLNSPHSAIGLSKFLPSCIHHRLPDNSLISVNL